MKQKEAIRPYTIPVLAVALVAAMFLSLMVGRYLIAPSEVIRLIAEKITGTARADEITSMVLFEVRLSRIMAAALIGGALAMAGATYQGIFRNPMVSPDILGASAGASFGAALAILLGLSPVVVQVLAFISGIVAVLLTLGVSSRFSQEKGGEILLLVLTGMVVSALFSAFVSITKYVADPYDTLPAITFWLMGGLSYITGSDVLIMLVPFSVGAVPLLLLRWKLNVLSLNEDEARSMGIDTVRLRIIVILCATLMTSSAVAIGGMIGWVGLVVPHLARMVTGPNFKTLLPVSLLMGGLYLLLVDDVARCAFAQEIPLGIITAIAGAPFFLYLIAKGRRGWI